jgi:hypothetical protein
LQSQFLHLRADLVHIAAEEARGLCNRLAVVEFVLEVTDVGLRPGLSVSTRVLAGGSHGRGCFLRNAGQPSRRPDNILHVA